MSEREQLERSIIEQCLGADSLLVAIRDNRLEDDKYKRLYKTIVKYHQIIGDDPLINRKVAGCLRLLEEVLESSVIHFQREREISEEARKMQMAWEEVWDLVNTILDGNMD